MLLVSAPVHRVITVPRLPIASRRHSIPDPARVGRWLALASAVIALLTQMMQLAERVWRLVGAR
jgi:hypothetical protein